MSGLFSAELLETCVGFQWACENSLASPRDLCSAELLEEGGGCENCMFWQHRPQIIRVVFIKGWTLNGGHFEIR